MKFRSFQLILLMCDLNVSEMSKTPWRNLSDFNLNMTPQVPEKCYLLRICRLKGVGK